MSGGRKGASSTGSMGTPALQSEQERPRQTTASKGSVAPVDGIQRLPSPCHGDDAGDSKDGETLGYSIPDLPEEIWRHIHSLMPMDAAARAACLSHAFLSSWRCYPKLILNRRMLCPKSHGGGVLRGRIDRILKNHSGIGLKILRLNLCLQYGSIPSVDNLLQVAVTPGIEELTLLLDAKYKFPCLLLSDGVRSTIRSLQLDHCVFHPTLELGPLRSLTRLILKHVCITGDELECLLSNSLALEHLHLNNCKEITFLKIPSVLLQLSYLRVFGCRGLQVIENKAPSLSCFTLIGEVSKLSLGEASQMKFLSLYRENIICYARAKFPSIMPNLETLVLGSWAEVNTPMLPSKFFHLKHLTIQVSQNHMEHESVFGGSSHLRQLPDYHHNRLKSFEVIGFSSAKGLVELTCCIVSAVSLERLTLDTLHGDGRCSSGGNECCPISKAVLEEAYRGVAAIRKYIEDKVPPTAKMIVLEPCPQCHTTTTDYYT